MMRGWEKFWYCKSEIKLWTTIYDFSKEILDIFRQYLRKILIAVVKKFGIAKDNFITKNACFEKNLRLKNID